MSRDFLLFGGRCYDEGGGWSDFIQSFDSFDEAKAFIDNQNGYALVHIAGYPGPVMRCTGEYQWAQIVHAEEVVASFYAGDRPDEPNAGWYDS